MNQMSEYINELAKSLAAAQILIEGAVKDETNPHFKSKFASLASVFSVIREPFSKNGLSVVQTTMPTPEGLFLVTHLLHSSGQWINSVYPLIPERNTPQGMGSCLSYARRYTLAAIAGVYQEDDDGEGAMNRDYKKSSLADLEEGQRLLDSTGIQNTSDPKPSSKTYAASTTKGVSDKQVNRLYAIAKKNFYSEEEVLEYLHRDYGLDHPANLNQVQYQEFCDYLSKAPSQQAPKKQWNPPSTLGEPPPFAADDIPF